MYVYVIEIVFSQHFSGSTCFSCSDPVLCFLGQGCLFCTPLPGDYLSVFQDS